VTPVIAEPTRWPELGEMTVNGHALVIVVSQYPQIQPLPPAADATDLAGVLRDPSACGYAPEHVMLLQESEATRVRILDELDRLAQRATRDATAIVYFSGHGGRSPGDRSESYLLPIDGAWGSPERLEATAISGQLLAGKLDAIGAERMLVVLDCCHAGGVPHARDVAITTWYPGARGRRTCAPGRRPRGGWSWQHRAATEPPTS
jgi:hypothetical protein